MRALVLAAAVLSLGAARAGEAKSDLSAVRDTSSVDQTGARLLQDTVTIHASVHAVWRALTDQAAYRAWVAPVSFIDFRIGGAIEVAFDPKGKPGDPANLRQQITAYVPERMIAFRNLASSVGPPGFAAYPELAVVIELRPLAGGDTEVVLSQVGYRQGKDFDALYGFFKSHNPEHLADLKAFAERAGR
jgi:uncharacterized protein YndB with AHSA1/START domain